MIDPVELGRLVGRFDSPNASSLPVDLCVDAARLLGVSDCTLAFIGATSRITLCASSPDAMSLDNWQFSLDEGPCLDAARTGSAFSADLSAAGGSPWPQLEAKALLIGYRSLGGVPLHVGGKPFGAMNIQNRTAGFGSDTLGDAQSVARALSEPIVSLMSEAMPPDFDQAGYANIHRATGMVSVQMGIPVNDAMAILRAHAWSEDMQLLQVADNISSGSLKFDPEKGSGRS